MKPYKAFASIIVIIASFESFSQVNVVDTNYSKFIFHPSVSAGIPLNSFRINQSPDYLIKLDDTVATASLDLLSFSYFFNRKWGLSAKLQQQFVSGFNSGNNKALIYQDTRKAFEGDYFLVGEIPFNYDERTPLGDIVSVLLGPTYRYSKNKWVVYSTVQLGFTDVEHSSFSTILKENGSNTYLDYRLGANNGDPKDRHERFFTVAPSFKLAYRLSHYNLVNIDVQYAYYTLDMQFQEELVDRYSLETVSDRKIEYKEGIHQLYLGIGLMFEIDNLIKYNY